MPLSFAKIGDTFAIKQISGLQKVKAHLESLGFVVGENISIVSKIGDNLIVNIKGSRLAIGSDMASRIMI